MKRILTFIVGVAIVAGAVHVATVQALPRVIMAKVMSAIAGDAEVNKFVEMPLATAAARRVVRPSPDLAYSVCILDLSKGAVRVQVPLTGPYTSVALYSSTTDNYFVRNDREAKGKELDVVIVPKGAAPANVPEGTDVVTAPTAKGLVLVRRVVESAEAFPALDEVRKKGTCAPFQG
ncbi:DUF1254 domain-containing protein [Parvibaculum sedimenti]|uniref:DUF1254 domain-containing protein n=1 Tax=Parvibaculum sedimenti TaxID=2608632 RepID=A0A6N6VLQ0_9HYPH|nr:DUF1254 domain-containing protein [Parvibaculum sedimenti]KAB7741657.1 DUF1254 domain-containing protein [Parvibaculum sedimenti]